MKINDKTVVHAFASFCLILLAVICLVPFLMIIAASLSSEEAIIANGYGIFPKDFTLAAYKELIGGMISGGSIIPRAYAVTIWNTVGSTALMLFTVTPAGYALSRKNYRWRKLVTYYWLIPMLIGAGGVANYIHISRTLGLRNSIWVLLIPGGFSAWQAFMLRNFMAKLDEGYIEAAKIDGASEFQILLKVFIPMTKPYIAVIAMRTMLSNWNEWAPCMLYMSDDRYITIQRYLQKILANISFMKQALVDGSDFAEMANLPSETLRMAICVVAAAPMVCLFMYFQKYFVKGIQVGGIKG